MPTIRQALSQAVQQLRKSESETPLLDAQVLLAAVLQVERPYLYTHDDEPLSEEASARFASWVSRRAAGEPIAYILGVAPWYDRQFIVSPAVLIPRPETELLLEQALAFAAQRAQPVAVDIGTGSGALAVTFAAHVPQAHVFAVDMSEDALTVARQNAARYQTAITFLHGDLLLPLYDIGDVKIDILMANLPYIATDELPDLAVTRYEPRMALDGGADGLDLVRRLLKQAPPLLNEGALILLEIGADQGAAALQLVQEMLKPVDAQIIKDLAGLDRIIRAVMP
ncbi:MAG: peptide chain release factor N(5)-glutamine methyltransferase [Chloroflexi bacterium]|nr:MAG: peptide chain release factor N(5)-glutamine methyltransferase [Chloroflexota bacterium]